jgi:hypothetical protein
VRKRRCQTMKENATQEGLLVRAEPLERAEEISKRMVDVVRLKDGALLLKDDSAWAGAIKHVLVTKGVRVDELRKQTAAERLIA